jgi:hypothetical protein
MRGGLNFTPFADITEEIEPSYEHQLEDALCQKFIDNNVEIVSRSGENDGVFEIEFNNFSLLHVPLDEDESRIEFHEKGDPYYPLIITFNYSTSMTPVMAANDIYTRGAFITPFYGDNIAFSLNWCN